MCGIAGKVLFDSQQCIEPSLVERMLATIVHRGPDDDGMYRGGQVVLGHRRLSIIDLSTGKQPISNEDRTVWIVFNGEIYNYKALRQELIAKGHTFETNTDTEVIVHLYEDLGPDCVTKLRGMFAFAIWDARKKALFLARDRVGIKPLYYHATSEGLSFASEIKALLADPALRPEVDPNGIARFLTFFYMPGTETLFRNVFKLEPGHYLLVQDGKVTIRQYWDLEFDPHPRNGNFQAAKASLVELLRETVRDHMISDVPVGILLSGGVDSTALLSFVVEEAGHGVNTYTVGFEGEQFADERHYARLAARKFGSQHSEMTITPNEFKDFLPKYVWHMEEPVCEPPAVALYYVTKLASKDVKVLISGEGGDEAFAGYQTYRNLIWLERLKRAGRPWTGAMAGVMEGLGHFHGLNSLGKYSSLMNVQLKDYYYSRSSGPNSYFNRTKGQLYSASFQEATKQIDPRESALGYFAHVSGQNVLNQMLYVDTKTWLPDDLLIKADKITMANSLELRVPFLDHKVLEFAAALPQQYKVQGFTTKRILKEAFDGRVPAEILGRKKTGFPVPVESWLNRDLKDFVRDILLDRKTQQRGYFERGAIEKLLDSPAGSSGNASELFSLVTLELWHRQFLDSGN
jgi:asparagine synthase (glutamine-hydrolysing)